jgi:acetolactate synthase-1/2/3 large subunit
MSEKTGGEAIVDSLIANNIDTVFGLPGAQLDPIFVAMHDRQDQIRLMHSRHEQGCAYMAYGYAEASGKIGTMLVVPGPGLLNAAAAIVTGYACNTPMQFATAGGLVKWARRVDRPENIPGEFIEALNQIRHHRPRPVYLEIPFDFAKEKSEIPDALVAASDQVRPEIETEVIDKAAAALAKAKCPLIVVGGGARMAGDAVRELAELLHAPVAMTQNALGTLDCRHELAFTQLGAHHWWSKADVVLALGTRLFPAAMAWGRDNAQKIIKVDIDAAELNRLPAPIDGIHGDVAEAAIALRDSLDNCMSKAAPDRSDEISAVRAAVQQELEIVAPQRELLQIIREELGEDGVLVSDLTQLYFAAQDVFPVHRPRTYIQPSYQGTLGHAAATCLGAQVAVGDRPVIGLAGDGGFMFTVQELATAVQYNIPVTFLVMNDGAFGNVKRILQEDYDDRVICADLQNPDFVKLAQSFGMPGRRASAPDDLRTALKESIAEPGPALVEYRAPEFPSPWPLHFRQKVRG